VRRQELADQVAVRAVDLHTAEAGLLDDARGTTKTRHDLAHLGIGQLTRGGKEGLHLRPERHGRRRHVLFVQTLGGLLAGVVELHPALRAVPRGGLRPGCELSQVGIAVDHHIARLAQGALVDHHVARDAQANAAIGPGPIQPRQLWRGRASAGAQGFAHGGLEQAVLHHHPIGQGEGLGQHGLGGHGQVSKEVVGAVMKGMQGHTRGGASPARLTLYTKDRTRAAAPNRVMSPGSQRRTTRKILTFEGHKADSLGELSVLSATMLSARP